MIMTTRTKQTVEEWLDQIDVRPEDARDATPFREIVAASEAVGAAEEALRVAVDNARRSGLSWSTIGAALGISKQAAHERFAGK
jgi:hypothetical protein